MLLEIGQCQGLFWNPDASYVGLSVSLLLNIGVFLVSRTDSHILPACWERSLAHANSRTVHGNQARELNQTKWAKKSSNTSEVQAVACLYPASAVFSFGFILSPVVYYENLSICKKKFVLEETHTLDLAIFIHPTYIYSLLVVFSRLNLCNSSR